MYIDRYKNTHAQTGTLVRPPKRFMIWSRKSAGSKEFSMYDPTMATWVSSRRLSQGSRLSPVKPSDRG